MRIGVSDLRSIATYALSGSLLAGVYGLTKVFVDRRCGYSLQTYAEAVPHDQTTLMLLCRLETYFRSKDIVCFARLVESVDRLIWLRVTLTKDVPPPDSETVYHHFEMVRRRKNELRCVLDRTCDVQHMHFFDSTISRLLRHLETIVVEIMKFSDRTDDVD